MRRRRHRDVLGGRGCSGAGAGALTSADVPTPTAATAAHEAGHARESPGGADARRAEWRAAARSDRQGIGRCQRGRDSGGDFRGRVGRRRGICADRRDVAAHLVQGPQDPFGLRVCADLFAHPGGGVVVQQAGLQVGEDLDRQRRVRTPEIR